MYSSSPKVVRIRIRAVLSVARIRRVAWSPSSSGMRMSIRIAVGSNCAAFATASSPLLASATTSMSCSPASSIRKPAPHGDPSGLWLLSWLSGVVLPQSFTWGELASIGMADAQPVERYFSSGADRGSIIGNPLGEFLWGAGGMAHAWPANPGENQYTSVQNSNVPTLLIGGTLDFETPAQNATKELLPHLSNGHQVILSELGHAHPH